MPPTKRNTKAMGKEMRSGRVRSSTTTTKSGRHDYTKLIGLKVQNSIDLVKHVEKGLAFSAVESLQHQMKLASKEMANLLDIKYRTFVRRKEAGRLQSTESDRVLRT